MLRLPLVKTPMAVRLALLLAAALVVTACSSASPSGQTVITTRSSPVGNHLTSSSGRAVYLFLKDGVNQSSCSGPCIGVWPPVILHGTLKASGGAVSGDLGSITRANGVKQVTYKGHPLYYYSGDSGPGTAKGQGLIGYGAKWWLVTTSGKPLT